MMITRISSTLILVLALGAGAAAQTLNMDMSWAMQSQAQNWNYGMAAAQQAAQNWYAQAQQYRAQTGYTGVISSGITAQDLMNANRGVQGAFDSYNQAWHGQSARITNALDAYANHAILGQGGYANPYTGQAYTLPNTATTQWVNPQGTTMGMNGWTPPSYNGGWTQLYPTW